MKKYICNFTCFIIVTLFLYSSCAWALAPAHQKKDGNFDSKAITILIDRLDTLDKKNSKTTLTELYNVVKDKNDDVLNEKHINRLIEMLQDDKYQNVWGVTNNATILGVLCCMAKNNRLSQNNINTLFSMLQDDKYQNVWGGTNDATILGVLFYMINDTLSQDHINTLFSMLQDDKYQNVWGGHYATILSMLLCMAKNNRLSQDHINPLFSMLQKKKYQNVWGGKHDSTILNVLLCLANNNKLSADNITNLIDNFDRNLKKSSLIFVTQRSIYDNFLKILDCVAKKGTLKNSKMNVYTIMKLMELMELMNDREAIENNNFNLSSLENNKSNQDNRMFNKILLQIKSVDNFNDNYFLKNIYSPNITVSEKESLFKKIRQQSYAIMLFISSFVINFEKEKKVLNYFSKFISPIYEQIKKFIEYEDSFKNNTTLQKSTKIQNAFMYSISEMSKKDLDQVIFLYTDLNKNKQTVQTMLFIQLLKKIKLSLNKDVTIPEFNLDDSILLKQDNKIAQIVIEAFKNICA